MSDAIKTNLVNQDRDHVYPVTKSELIIMESGIDLEESINSKADRSRIIRFNGLDSDGFAILTYYNEGMGEWRPIGTIATDIPDCGWETQGPGIIQSIQNIQTAIPSFSRNGHRHQLSDLEGLNVITDAILHLQTNPNVGPQGEPGLDGNHGENGLTPHIDPLDRTWRIGGHNTGVVAQGRNGLDFSSRWAGQTFVSIGSTITWQDAQFINQQSIVGYQRALVNQLDFSSYTTIAQEGSTVGQILDVARNANYIDYNLAIIEVGISDYRNSISIEDFQISIIDLIETIRRSNPLIPIIIFTPMQFPNTSIENEEGRVLLDYVKVIFKVSNDYAIPVCDLYHNSGISPLTIPNFIHDADRLNNAGLARVSMNIVGAVHMFNGSSSMSISINEEIEDEEDETKPIVTMPQVDGDATELLQSYFSKKIDRPKLIIFPEGEWNISSIEIPSDTTLLLSENTVIKQPSGIQMAMFISDDAKNISIVNGSFESDQFIDFKNCRNVTLQNIRNTGGEIKFEQVSGVKLSGHITRTVSPIEFNKCSRIKLEDITFSYSQSMSGLFKISDCHDVKIDDIYDYNMGRTNQANGVIFLTDKCRRVRIGENINLGIPITLIGAYGYGELIQRGRKEILWIDQPVEVNDFIMLSQSINDFEKLCFHIDDGSVIPVDFRSGRFTIKDHTMTDGHTFLRESVFVLNGDRVIHFESHICHLVVWATDDGETPEEPEEGLAAFEEEYEEDYETEPDWEWNPDEDSEEESPEEPEWIMPDAEPIKITRITGERIRF